MADPTNPPLPPDLASTPQQKQVVNQANSNDVLAQIQQQIQAAGGGSSSTDLYGLGQWRDQPIDPSGFPPSIALLLQGAGINLSQKITGAQLAQAIEQVKNPALVAQLQQMLFYAGAYGSNVSSLADLQVGTFGDADSKALAQEITSAGRTGAPFGTYLTTAANYGKANGILGAVTGSASKPVQLPAGADEDAVLRAEAHTLYGHDPTPDQFARFQAFYNTKIKQAAQALVAAQNPDLGNLPDAATLGTAIGHQAGSQFGAPLAAPPQTVLSGARHFEGEPGQRGRMVADTTTNPAFADYQNQVAQDQGAMAAVNSAGQAIDQGAVPIVGDKLTLPSAADEFLRQDNPGAVGAQNVASKYRTLLSILGGQ